MMSKNTVCRKRLRLFYLKGRKEGKMKIFRYTAIAIFIIGAVLISGLMMVSEDPAVRTRGIVMLGLLIGLLRWSKANKK